jgi:hypothetical protein
MSNSIGTSFSPSASGKSGWSSGGVIAGPGISENIFISNNPSLGRPSLGGGLRGIMPQSVMDHDNSHEFAKTRFFLRDAWNTSSYSGSGNPKRIIGPFRAVNNAGDLLSRQNYSCGGSCQSVQSRPGLKGLKHRFGSISDACTASTVHSLNQVNPNIPASSCNSKFVYDGSDYINFKKKQAMNKSYNDRSFGGDNFSAAQSAMRAIRRY